MRRLIGPFAAAALAAVTLPAPAASAAPLGGAQLLPLSGEAPALTLASGGCGPYRHRGFNGFCYPGGGFYRPYGYYRPYAYRPYGYGYGYRRYGFF